MRTYAGGLLANRLSILRISHSQKNITRICYEFFGKKLQILHEGSEILNSPAADG